MNENDLRDLIAAYVESIETGSTITICKCLWEDLNDESGRKRLVGFNMDCPLHSREGMLLDFVNNNAQKLLNYTSVKLVNEAVPSGEY